MQRFGLQARLGNHIGPLLLRQDGIAAIFHLTRENDFRSYGRAGAMASPIYFHRFKLYAPWLSRSAGRKSI